MGITSGNGADALIYVILAIQLAVITSALVFSVIGFSELYARGGTAQDVALRALVSNIASCMLCAVLPLHETIALVRREWTYEENREESSPPSPLSKNSVEEEVYEDPQGHWLAELANETPRAPKLR